MNDAQRSAWQRAMPMVFVLIWSTGFIVARFGMPHSPPGTFLSIRYALSLLCFGSWIVWSRVSWPRTRAQWGHLCATGVLMHAGYLGGVWAAVKAGMGAGTIALLVGLQPVLTALWLSALAHKSPRDGASGGVSRRQWMGLCLGLVGLLLVVWRKLGVGEVNHWNLLLAMAALLSITVGTLYQKRYVQPCDVRSANAVQLLAALLVSLPWAWMEHGSVDMHPEFLGALAWSVLVLTVGGSSLLYMLIQQGVATRVTSLLYLVPPTTALMAWLIFGETFTPLMAMGMVLTVLGVALVVRAPKPS